MTQDQEGSAFGAQQTWHRCPASGQQGPRGPVWRKRQWSKSLISWSLKQEKPAWGSVAGTRLWGNTEDTVSKNKQKPGSRELKAGQVNTASSSQLLS